MDPIKSDESLKLKASVLLTIDEALEEVEQEEADQADQEYSYIHKPTRGLYGPLADVLKEAFDQAAKGKGAERHADNKPFVDQPIFTVAGRHGVGFLLGQAEKKIGEAEGLNERGGPPAAVPDLLGAINYIAAAIIWLRQEDRF